MRKILLAGAAALALFTAVPARAQIPVTDAAHIAETIARSLQQIQQMRMQYNQLVRTYESVTGARSVGGMADAVGGVARGYMPEAGTVADLLNGRINPGSIRRGGEFLSRNRVFNPGGDEWSEEMERREHATASAQALAYTAVEDAQERIGFLDSLRAVLEGDFDLRQLGAYQGAIQLEQQNLSGHQQQLQQVQTMLAAENRVDQLRAEQRWRRDVDDYEAKMSRGLSGW